MKKPILKKRWKPKHDEKFYYISLRDFCIRSCVFDSFDYAEQVSMRHMIKHGLVFESIKLARVKLKAIKAILKEG